MEGDGSVASSTATPTPIKSMMTSSSLSSGLNPPAAPAPVGGCSETAKTAEGKRLKIDTDDRGVGATLSTVAGGKSKSEKGTEAGVKDDNGEASGGGSGMPLVREQLHPLENPVILVHLFERCPPPLLAKFRLVSKQWLDLSLTSWRDTARLTLHDDSWYGSRPSGFLTIGKYLEFVDNPVNKCWMKPHRRMKLVSWQNDLNKEPFQSFWNQIGRNLTSLEFSSCDFERAEDLRRIIFASCPNLKGLSFRTCTFLKSARAKDFRDLKYVEPTFGEQTNLKVLTVVGPRYEQHPLPINWLDLLSHFPSLTTLMVSLNGRFPPRTEAVHEELFKAIGIIRKRDSKKLCLRSFGLYPPLKFLDDLGLHPDLSHFEELQLPQPVQLLEIEVDSSRKPRSLLLEDVLNRHRNTLLRVTVSRVQSHRHNYSRGPYSWEFPCNVVLEKLEELQIHMLCTSMKFLENTPKLKKLEFLVAPGYGPNSYEETNLFPEPYATTLLGLKLLHLTEFRMDYRVTPQDVTSFARMMPNVRKLKMSLSDPLFEIVCRYLKDLKEMEVLGKDLTDKGVTGLAGDGGRAPADITDLQDLESFKFWSRNLTEQSVVQGFLKLPSLKFLEACDGIMTMGEAARKAIRDRNIDFEEYYDDYSEDAGRDYEDFVGGSD